MTKNEIKHAIWRAKVNGARKRKLFAVMFMFVFALFVVPCVAAAINDPASAEESITLGGGTAMLASSMALIGNIDDTSDHDAAGKQIAYQVWLIAIDQVNKNVPFPKPNSNREIGNIPLLEGQVMHYFEAHDIPTDDSKGEKGDFSTAVTTTFVVAMSGNRDVLLNFIEAYAGGKFIIIYRECESDNYFLLGNVWKPMILKSFERANNKDKRGVTFTFENSSFRQPYKYIGAIVTAPPVSLAPGATTLAIVPGNDIYIATNGADAATPITTISGITANDKGRTITIRGAGTDKSATIEDGAVFVLEGGATWIAKSGSSITLRVLDQNRLVEVNGTRIQTA